MKKTGKVCWFDEKKGFGFIAPDDGGKDLFVHYAGILRNGREPRNLGENQRVQFDVENHEKGQRAINVERIRS